MKNNTKIRLHLSKQLFESLTKQVIAEAKGKNYGTGMEEVKKPKAKKEKVEESTEMVDENTLADLMSKLKTLPADKLKQLKAYWDNNLSPEAVRTGKVKGVTLPSNIEEMETRVAETPGMKKPIAEMTTSDMEFYKIGEWAADLLDLATKSEGDLIQLGGNVLTAATLGTMGAATGLIMYSDKIKAGITKAADMLKSLARGKKTMGEGEGEDLLSQLKPETLAALKK